MLTSINLNKITSFKTVYWPALPTDTTLLQSPTTNVFATHPTRSTQTHKIVSFIEKSMLDPIKQLIIRFEGN